jgi:hypothetical protein
VLLTVVFGYVGGAASPVDSRKGQSLNERALFFSKLKPEILG